MSYKRVAAKKSMWVTHKKKTLKFNYYEDSRSDDMQRTILRAFDLKTDMEYVLENNDKEVFMISGSLTPDEEYTLRPHNPNKKKEPAWYGYARVAFKVLLVLFGLYLHDITPISVLFQVYSAFMRFTAIFVPEVWTVSLSSLFSLITIVCILPFLFVIFLKVYFEYWLRALTFLVEACKFCSGMVDKHLFKPAMKLPTQISEKLMKSSSSAVTDATKTFNK